MRYLNQLTPVFGCSVIIRLPEHCSPERAALAEPLSVVLHALRRASLQPGHTVLVLGAGSIGILAGSLAKALGASRVAAADINLDRLNWSQGHGIADDTYHIDLAHPPLPLTRTNSTLPEKNQKTGDESIRRARETAQHALRQFGTPEGFDIVVECTGAESSAQMGIFVSRAAAYMLKSRISLKPYFFPAVRQNRWQTYASRNGHIKYESSHLCCSHSGSRYSRYF